MSPTLPLVMLLQILWYLTDLVKLQLVRLCDKARLSPFSAEMWPRCVAMHRHAKKMKNLWCFLMAGFPGLSCAVSRTATPACWSICPPRVADGLSNECGFHVGCPMWSLASHVLQPWWLFTASKLASPVLSRLGVQKPTTIASVVTIHWLFKTLTSQLISCSHGVFTMPGDHFVESLEMNLNRAFTASDSACKSPRPPPAISFPSLRTG